MSWLWTYCVFKSHIGRGIGNIINRNIIRGISNIVRKNVIRRIRGNAARSKNIFIRSDGVKEDVSWGIIDWREIFSEDKGGSVVIVGTGIGISGGARTMDGDIIGKERGDWSLLHVSEY